MTIISDNSFVKRHPIETILIIVVIILSFLTFKYRDTITLTAWSVEIWEALFNGRITEYYRVTAENPWNSFDGGTYGGILYLVPWAVWNFPIWLIGSITNNCDASYAPYIMWSKLFLLFCMVIMSLFVSKIISEYTNNDKIAVLGFIISMSTGTGLFIVGYAGQDEMTYITLFVIGLYEGLVSNKKKAICLFVISSILCPIMILPTLIVVMIWCKNIIKYIPLLLFCVLPEKLVSILCGSGEIMELYNEYKMATYYSLSHHIYTMFWPSLIGDANTPSIIAAIFAACLIIAYLYRNDDRKKELLFAINVISLCFIAMVIFCRPNLYRMYLYVPFTVISVLILYNNNIQNGRIALLVACVFEWCASYIGCTTEWGMRYESTEGMLLQPIKDTAAVNFYEIICDKFELFRTLNPLIYGLMFTLCIVMCYLLFQKNRTIENNIREKYIVIGFSLCPILIMLLFYFVPLIS